MGNPRIQHFRRTDNGFIDGVALAASLVWLGVMFGVARSVDVPLFTALKRGLVSSMLVYSFVFVGLYVMVRLAYKRVENSRKSWPRKAVSESQ